MYNDSYKINTADYLKRKQNFEERVIAMIEYIKKPSGCRSQHVANYFTDVKINACGICDNCINEKVIYISTEEFNSISNQIMNITKNEVMSAEEILISLKGINKVKIWKVLEYLQAEEKILLNKEGLFINKI